MNRHRRIFFDALAKACRRQGDLSIGDPQVRAGTRKVAFLRRWIRRERTNCLKGCRFLQHLILFSARKSVSRSAQARTGVACAVPLSLRT